MQATYLRPVKLLIHHNTKKDQMLMFYLLKLVDTVIYHVATSMQHKHFKYTQTHFFLTIYYSATSLVRSQVSDAVTSTSTRI